VDSPSRLLHQAEELGIEIGICDGKAYECPSGVEIEAKSKQELRKSLEKFEGLDYIIVHGGEEKVNRLAVSDSRVDILAHPSLKRRDFGVDPFVARQASKNGIAIEVNLSDLISSRRSARVYAIKNIKRNLMLSRKYGFDILATTGGRSRFELRSADVVSEILALLGFNEDETLRAMEEVPERIIR
jgi:ribonuclease P/MRP protein subunit RPP1